MAHGLTTSIRLPPKLRNQLENAAHNLHRGKNWIIVQALEEYLNKLYQRELVDEAKRQSILASRDEKNDTWEDDTDTSGWT